jgi:hypothetical protein
MHAEHAFSPTPCNVRLELERRLADAVRERYAAKDDTKDAVRIAERHALEALEKHIKEHGCQPTTHKQGAGRR